MTIWKGVLIIIGVISVLFIFELVGLGFFKFFEPKKENIRREVFENTKSYVHGKIQDLAKYYKEYEAGDEGEKLVLESVIRSQFASFDESKIESATLRSFLTKTRGY